LNRVGCRRGSTKAAPGGADRKEEHDGPEEERQAKLQEDAENKRGRRKNGAHAFDKRIANLKNRTCKTNLKRGAVVFHKCNANVCLGDG